MRRKGTKRKAKAKAEAEAEASQEVPEEAAAGQQTETTTMTNKAPRAKRVKASKPDSEIQYFEDQRNLEDLWKAVFPVGTEWDQLDAVYQYNWNFSNLEEAFDEGGRLYGQKVYLWGCTEPQMVTHNDVHKVICIPIVVAVVSPFPPSDKIGINSVQREAEEIVPMKKMKMDWVPYIPLENRDRQVERLKSQIYILSCTQRRTALRHMKVDRIKKYEYCLPYFYQPLKEDELDQSTVVDIIYPAEPPVVCDFDWELDELEEFTDERIKEESLPEDQKDAFKEFVKEKVREAKRKNREAREARKMAIEEMSAERRAAFENMKFYKFYPVQTPDTPEVSKKEAIKCMRHSKRTTLTAEDVDGALKLRNVEPLYGFASGGPLRFRRAIGHRDLFYLDDKDVDFKDVIEAPLPKAPLDTSILCHWLAIEGVQPAIPENAPVEVIAPPPDGKSTEQKDGLPVDIKLPVRHILSRELQLYFDKITELTVSRSDSVLFKEALMSLATDSGLHPLVPYFTYFVADEVSRGLNDYSLLLALMRVVQSLLQNPHIHIEPYLHQLMPSVVTCLVAKRLGNRLADNHWELRDFTANLVAAICKRFGHVYNTLQPRLTKTLLNALLDPKKALTQHYGAIQGLAALGPNVVRLLVLPNLESYLHLLEPEMLLEKQKNEVKRHEAWRVYGAFLHAAGQCVYDRLKMFPPLLSPPALTVWKTNAKVITSVTNKRKASMDCLDQQPPNKRIATDGPISVVSTSSSPSPMEEETTVPVPLGDSDVGTSQSPGLIPCESRTGSKRGRDGGSNTRALKMSAILPQIWKDDLNSGQVLVSVFNLFGEGILSFIPAPEMSLFL